MLSEFLPAPPPRFMSISAILNPPMSNDATAAAIVIILIAHSIWSCLLKTSKRSLTSFFIPLFGPMRGTDTGGILSHLSTVVAAGILDTQDPLIVPVPAVSRLVGRGESQIPGGGANRLDLLHGCQLFLGEVIGDFIVEDFVELGGSVGRHLFRPARLGAARLVVEHFFIYI
jgi:hypothetical protein